MCVGKRKRDGRGDIIIALFLTHLPDVAVNVSLNSTSAECATS